MHIVSPKVRKLKIMFFQHNPPQFLFFFLPGALTTLYIPVTQLLIVHHSSYGGMSKLVLNARRDAVNSHICTSPVQLCDTS